jgi:hypothetical protein
MCIWSIPHRNSKEMTGHVIILHQIQRYVESIEMSPWLCTVNCKVCGSDCDFHLRRLRETKEILSHASFLAKFQSGFLPNMSWVLKWWATYLVTTFYDTSVLHAVLQTPICVNVSCHSDGSDLKLSHTISHHITFTFYNTLLLTCWTTVCCDIRTGKRKIDY